MKATAPAPELPGGVPPLNLEQAGAKTKRPTLSSEKRSSSAPKERPPPPLTPRARKASRSLFRELEGTVKTMHHARTRTEQTTKIVLGTIKELQASVKSGQTRLADNRRMVAGTKETQAGQLGSPKKPKSPAASPGASVEARPLTEVERELLKRELRDQNEANGEERDATAEEIDDKEKKILEDIRIKKEFMQRRSGTCNKPIVEGLEKLVSSSAKSAEVLDGHARTLALMLESLDEIIDNLCDHKDKRDSLFDPMLSTDLPFAKRMGVKRIERSVLYQKMNFVPKDKHGRDMVPDWNDKDQESAEGKSGPIKDAKGGVGLTGHEATFCAAEREDTARAVCNQALKAVRDAQSQLASRKSQLQVAVLNSRDQMLRAKRAVKTGNFGSSEQRNTDPATRKMASNPEDQ